MTPGRMRGPKAPDGHMKDWGLRNHRNVRHRPHWNGAGMPLPTLRTGAHRGSDRRWRRPAGVERGVGAGRGPRTFTVPPGREDLWTPGGRESLRKRPAYAFTVGL